MTTRIGPDMNDPVFRAKFIADIRSARGEPVDGQCNVLEDCEDPDFAMHRCSLPANHRGRHWGRSVFGDDYDDAVFFDGEPKRLIPQEVQS